MAPETWRKISELTADALELPPAQREQFLQNCCADSDEIHESVRNLIAEFEQADENFLRPLIDVPIEWIADLDDIASEQHSFESGDIIEDRFEIIRFIAEGGMGEVYEAFDREIGTVVAIKTVRSEISSVPGMLDRFRQEVKQAMLVSHKNVCRVHNLFIFRDRSPGCLAFFAMEYLDGQTLASYVREHGPFTPAAAMPVIEQIVNGLQALHDVGIVHRDLKSSNILLVSDGKSLKPVITDFGIARMATLQSDFSRDGTPAYMAPEQIISGTAGFASDQFSLGVVLFEMLTGRLPFPGDSMTRVAHSTAYKRPPCPRQFAGKVPKRWAKAIIRCLEFDPAYRHKDLSHLLRAVRPVDRKRLKAAIASAAALLACAAVGIVLYGWSPIISNAVPLTSENDLSGEPSFSRDGHLLAYSSDRGGTGKSDVWVHDFTSADDRRVTRDNSDDSEPALSPDGKLIAFRSERKGGGIYLIGTDGTGERLLATDGHNPQFSPDGRNVAYWVGEFESNKPSARVFIVSIETGIARQAVSGFVDARTPLWSPDGRELLFEGCRDAQASLYNCWDWWIKPLDSLRYQKTGGTDLFRRKGFDRFQPPYLWTGNHLYVAAQRGTEQRLFRVNFNRALSAVGAEQLCSDEVNTSSFTVSRGKTVAFCRLTSSEHIWEAQIEQQRFSVPARLTGDMLPDYSPTISRDGRWLAFARNSRRILRYGIETHELSEVVRPSTPDEHVSDPVLSDSGDELAFTLRNSDGSQIRTVRRDGRQETVCRNCGRPTDWIPNRREILITTQDAPSRIARLDLQTGKLRVLLENGDMVLDEAQISNDSRFVLFAASKQPGHRQLFLAECEPRSDLCKNWSSVTETQEWADRPHWSPNQDVIYYLSTRDSHACIWGRRFRSTKPYGTPFEIIPYHDLKLSPGLVFSDSFNFAVSGRAVYLNPAQIAETILLGSFESRAAQVLPRNIADLFAIQP